MRNRIIAVVLGVLVVYGVVLAVIASRRKGPRPSGDAGFARPMPWTDVREPAAGAILVSQAALKVGGLEVSAPQPQGARLSWSAVEDGARKGLKADGEVAGAPATFAWRTAQGNPHTVFSGEVQLGASAWADPLISSITLGDGELTYVDSTLTRVPFAGTPIEISALTAGPIVWRNGADVLSLWQWHADQVVLAANDEGGYVVQLHWWDPAQHELPEGCESELKDLTWTLKPGVTISFGEVPDVAIGRLPNGVASAVVPIFIDPLHVEDPKYRDGASRNPADFAGRARTIALGYSSPTDARYGNGGLAGLGVGGTIVVPADYAGDDTAFEDLRSTLADTPIEFVPEAQLRPDDCAVWREAASDRTRALLGRSRPFDGKFPNLFAIDQRGAAPGLGPGATIWHPTALTGRRKDVVTQALSSTYLSRLAEARGLAVLEIPLVATRNPLIPAAAEALLEPERKGNWTIQEELARALAEVELLSEDDRFDFVGLRALSNYVRRSRDVVMDEVGNGKWLVHNDGDDEVAGFTLIAEGKATPVVDSEPVEHKSRPIGNGSSQTWLWWDLAPGATYELQLSEDPGVRRGVQWALSD